MATWGMSIRRNVFQTPLLKPRLPTFSRLFSLFPPMNGESSLDDSVSAQETGSSQNGSQDIKSEDSSVPKMIYDRPLENGIDPGIYKAILVGQVGQRPLQKKLRSGTTVTLLSIGTGGIRNNRRPLENEDPLEYASRCSTQWHRVSIFQQKLGDTVTKHLKPGSIVYVEGNLEGKVFVDPVTGLVRRIREIAIRRNGRLVYLGHHSGDETNSEADTRETGTTEVGKFWQFQ